MQSRFNVKDINYFLLFPILNIFFIIVTFNADTLSNLLDLHLTEAILYTDYIAKFGLSASLISVSLVALVNIYIFRRLEMPASGLMVASYLTVYGFSFLGMNLVNLLPIYLGGYVYAKVNKVPVRNVALLVILAGTLGPIVSHIMFGYQSANILTILIGVGVGMFMGYIIVPLGIQTIQTHDVYHLYNIGYAGGLFALAYNAVARGLGYNADIVPVPSQHLEFIMVIYMMASILILVVIAWMYPKTSRNYSSILKSSGRSISDFFVIGGIRWTYINMAVLGVLSTLAVVLSGAAIDSLMLAAFFTVIGFGAFGKHPRNVVPVAVGACLCAVALGYDLSHTATWSPILFATTLAPIAGQYGPIWGLASGAFHVFVSAHVTGIYAGLNLYSNGFAGGIVATIMLVLIQSTQGGQHETKNR